MIKTAEQIEGVKKSAEILSRVMTMAVGMVDVGVSGKSIDEKVEAMIRKEGGIPSFKNYGEPPFPASVCFSINDEVVHGIPTAERVLQDGDIVTLDIGVNLNGYYSDMAVTVPVGNISPQAQTLMDVTRESLKRAIAVVKPGNTITDISRAVQNYAQGNNMGIVREFVGHGVGLAVHEDPRIPNYVHPSNFDDQVILEEGMILAIEPMLTTGDYHVKVASDNWTVITADSSLAAHFEHTVLVTADGAQVLTKREGEEYV